MLKSVKEFLGKGVEVYPILSLLIFFLFFVGLFWWVFSYKKKTIKELSDLPLEDDENGDNENKKDDNEANNTKL